MRSITVHLGEPRNSKPEDRVAYGKLREKIIQSPWQTVTEKDFLRLVTEQGRPFYQALMNGRDLMELGQEKLCWRQQVFLGLDFDRCPLTPQEMIAVMSSNGYHPWLGYNTFSNDPMRNVNCYRLLWKVDLDLNVGYDEVAMALKQLWAQSLGYADNKALNPTRLWQGTNSGHFHHSPVALPLNIKQLIANP